jgi:hypothetical protein
LDRNNNGLIDDATELFGNLTPQQSSDPNGFKALAQFDKHENGGNEDGIIDERDAIYSKLRVWIDTNHNGVSDPGELITLREAGVGSISLTYDITAKPDENGNIFQYRGWVSDLKHEYLSPIYDVLLVSHVDAAVKVPSPPLARPSTGCHKKSVLFIPDNLRSEVRDEVVR